MKRIMSTNTPDTRALRVRIKLRNELNREPSAAELQKHLTGRKSDEVTQRDVSTAFGAGEEVCSRRVPLTFQVAENTDIVRKCGSRVFNARDTTQTWR
jgi:hypothetical protein